MINLVSILKHCPKGTKLYSPIFGEVTLYSVNNRIIDVIATDNSNETIHIKFSRLGRLILGYSDAECVLFPSKDQRDWSKFTAPWYKKSKFDPKTLQPFAKVLVRDNNDKKWECSLFSRIINHESFPFKCVSSGAFRYCIPYNEDTKHLVGTYKEAPKYYKYWKD